MANVIRNNRLIKRTVLRSYLPCFLIAFVFNLNWLIDIVLAAAIVSKNSEFMYLTSFVPTNTGYNAVAAIGIAFPVVALATSFLLAFVQGTSIRYNDALARGYKDECTKIFSQGVWTVLLTGIAFSIINFFVADYIVRLFGAEDNLLVHYAANYLRFSGLGFTFAALNRLYYNTLNVYGKSGSIFVSNIFNIVLNILLSILFYGLFGKMKLAFIPLNTATYIKETFDIGALALGTCAAEAITFLINVGFKHHYRIEAKLRFVTPSFKAFIKQFKMGFPVVASIFIESLIAALVNIIILKANCWTDLEATSALTIYTVVRSFWQISQVSSQAMGLSTIPMLGLFYGAKDKEAVKDVWKNGTVAGILFTFIWAIVLMALTPLIFYAYGSGIEGLTNYIGWGIMCVVPCSIFFTFIYMLQTFYAVIDKPLPSILVSAIPEAFIFPVALVILLNVIPGGTNNLFVIWLCMGLNSVVFFLVAYIGSIIKNKTLKIDLDRLLQTNNGQCNKLPVFDVSINKIEEVSQLAETIQAFFKENEVSERTSMFAALAVDELANDIMTKGTNNVKKLPENIPYLDIKIMSEKNYVKIVIRDAGNIYNPLAFDQLEDNAAKFGVKAVQKMANYIQYQRVYKMNIVTIEIAK